MRYKKIALIMATALCACILASCGSKEASSDQVVEESAETSLDEESTLSESDNPDTDSDESKLQDKETEDGDATETAESENKEPTDTTDEKETSSMTQDKIVELPPSGYDKKRPGVTYPEFKTYTYYSNTAERDTNMNVLLPVDYSEDKEYPVLYILHGFFDDETWMARDVVAIPEILTNLQLDGEAEEMIVVLPYIYCDKNRPTVTGMDLENCYAYDNFINDYVTDVKPFVESTFSVSKDREKTAITGFSMGGRESLFIAFKHPEYFGYVGAVCPAPGLVKIENSPMHPGQITPSEMVFGDYVPNAILITSSKADNVVAEAPDSYRAILTENGYDFYSHVLESTFHDPSSVKPHLYNYFRLLFK